MIYLDSERIKISLLFILKNPIYFYWMSVLKQIWIFQIEGRRSLKLF